MDLTQLWGDWKQLAEAAMQTYGMKTPPIGSIRRTRGAILMPHPRGISMPVVARMIDPLSYGTTEFGNPKETPKDLIDLMNFFGVPALATVKTEGRTTSQIGNTIRHEMMHGALRNYRPSTGETPEQNKYFINASDKYGDSQEPLIRALLGISEEGDPTGYAMNELMRLQPNVGEYPRSEKRFTDLIKQIPFERQKIFVK